MAESPGFFPESSDGRPILLCRAENEGMLEALGVRMFVTLEDLVTSGKHHFDFSIFAVKVTAVGAPENTVDDQR